MSYNNFVGAISVAFILSSCEIIKITDSRQAYKPVKQLITDREYSIGTINAFKIEADNNNAFAMLDFIANKDSYMLAVDKVELNDELQRLCRVISHQEITQTKIDTLSDVQSSIFVQLNYNKNYRYYLTKLDSTWYIYDYEKLSVVDDGPNLLGIHKN